MPKEKKLCAVDGWGASTRTYTAATPEREREEMIYLPKKLAHLHSEIAGWAFEVLSAARPVETARDPKT